MSSEKFYITTAIDYPNGDPHLGHAYEKVVADCYARWYRLLGKDVFFLTGTDENGQKLSKSAEKTGLSTMAYVDENVAKFQKLCADLLISNNDFIRTTEARHQKITAEIWFKLEQKGDIYVGRYHGNYCLACEAFYPESQAKDNLCPVHETPLVYTEEDGYFFKLSAYHDWIVDHITNQPGFLFPRNIRTELLSRLNGEKLADLSISRPNQGWGIPVPNNPKFVIYTWFDALINYLTAVQSDPGQNRMEYWPANIHVIGKDITWFHAIIWPAILKSAGYELPKQVYVHGMVLGNDGKRMSKTLGNGVDPQECLKTYPVDSFRYYLLKAIPSGQDGAFSTTDLVRFHNSDLANELGNLLSRVIKLTQVNLGDTLAPPAKIDFELEIFPLVSEAMDQREHVQALNHIWSGVRKLNAYLNEHEPWKKKDDKEALARIMYTSLLNLNLIITLLKPFIPQAAEKAIALFGVSGNAADAMGLKHQVFQLRDCPPLFPRLV